MEVWQTQLEDATRVAGLKGTWTSRGPMKAYISHPGPLGHSRPTTGFPVVIVAHHAVGIFHASFLREYCDALAEEGYLAVLPDFFHRVWSEQVPNGFQMDIEKMDIKAMTGSLRDSEIIADLESTLVFLAASSLYSDMRRIAVLGFCMGGRIAWLAGTDPGLSRAVRAIVSYHGGNL
eukprot:CAMPEP_0176092928 /NCGR_PEP_ID=MMETSP0120_2-20121206/46560_1 /TAXON_ID=160619 /ORGANISM="Kryptoperidinium foliaceum, Strain CCMP 1326" /LENGTH=176 /DNA_ID=CAMNT_0017426853 /DNA_START=12 /DNA_END=539 /DNA_ORIENTATION=+